MGEPVKTPGWSRSGGQHILRAGRGKLKPRAPLQRLQQQMHLRIVAQRLEVADADDRGGDGLMIDHRAGAELHRKAEPVQQHPLQDLQLDRAHELDVDAARPLLPDHVELGVLLL